MDRLIVMAKQGENFYIKARDGNMEIPEPIIGQRYNCANMITSPVIEFESHKNGYKIKTLNSTYLFYTDELENIETLAKENGLPEMVEGPNGSKYWGFDNRISTYVL